MGDFDIKYMPQTSIKGQFLADLVAEFVESPIETLTKLRNVEEKPVGMVSAPKPPCWKVYVDSAANQRGFGVGLILITPQGATIEKSLRLGLQGMAMV